MQHTLLANLDELLSPETLSRLTGVDVVAVERSPLSAGFAHSGSGLEIIQCRVADGPAGGDRTANSGPGPRLVLKRVAAEWDWLMRVTEDHHCRSVGLWTHGLFDRLPAQCEPPVLACSRDGSDESGGRKHSGEAHPDEAHGWALLMQDYGESIMTNRPFSIEENRLFLSAAATLHAEFLGDPTPTAEGLGLCRLEHVYGMFSPATARAEIALGHKGEIPSRILEGWELAHEVMPPDVMKVVAPLVEDPAPLCAALRCFPQTLVHGDFRHSNLAAPRSVPGPSGTTGDLRLVLLDWQLAAHAPPAVELGRYLGANSPLLPESKDACLEYYREQFFAAAAAGKSALDRSESDVRDWWDAQQDLGLLGGFVQDGWAIVLKATHWHVGADAREHWKADLDWWTEQVRRGARSL